MKKIAVINDLSGFGRCSLTAAISTISVMGVQPCPFPTAVLSAQTGYKDSYCVELTDKMPLFQSSWEKMQASFDGIYTGFAINEQQIQHMIDFVEAFQKKGTFFLADPIMGDHGKRFDIFTPLFCEKMRELAKRADIITPNITELCILTGTDYRIIENIAEEKELITTVHQIASEFQKEGPQSIVVTGIQFQDEQTGENKIGNLAIQGKDTYMSSFPYIGGSYSGTGDLFASIIAGGIARGKKLEELIDLAGAFIEKAITDAVAAGTPRDEGVEYARYLYFIGDVVKCNLTTSPINVCPVPF